MQASLLPISLTPDLKPYTLHHELPEDPVSRFIISRVKFLQFSATDKMCNLKHPWERNLSLQSLTNSHVRTTAPSKPLGDSAWEVAAEFLQFFGVNKKAKVGLQDFPKVLYSGKPCASIKLYSQKSSLANWYIKQWDNIGQIWMIRGLQEQTFLETMRTPGWSTLLRSRSSCLVLKVMQNAPH